MRCDIERQGDRVMCVLFWGEITREAGASACQGP